MDEIVLITGANGMLAKNLAGLLKINYTIRYLSRRPKNKNEYRWDIDKKFIDSKALEGVNHIIHLAGSSIADKRWSKKRRIDIVKSRVESATLIKNELTKQNITIDTFISASAVGYYGTETTEKIYTEESPKGNDFLSDVCVQWESIAETFKTDKIANRVCIIRAGIIVANDGALKKMIQPIKYGFGAVIGQGNQWIPWIHITDLSRIFMFLLENKNIDGVFNGVAPNHITNEELIRKIAKHLGKKIILPKIPEVIIRILFGKSSIILLKGSRVSSEKIMNLGFTYKFKTIDETLKDLIELKDNISTPMHISRNT